MPLITTVETVRVDLPEPGEWVEVKERLSAGDRKRIEAASFRLRIAMPKAGNGTGAPDGNLDIEYEAAAFAALETAIVAWSFDAKVTPAAIRQLDEESYGVIVAAINKLWSPRTEAEKNG